MIRYPDLAELLGEPTASGAPTSSNASTSEGLGRRQRLAAGLAAMPEAVRRVDRQRFPLLLGALFIAAGFALIGLGWIGVSGSGHLFEQLPFIASGGLGGLALVIVGSSFYFSWWVTRLVLENREQAAAAAAHQEEILAQQRTLLEELRLLRIDAATPTRPARRRV